MAIAMMYVSPIVIVALNDGKRSEKGTVIKAKTASQIHPLL
jgi:hypothetical protein